jgi:hypothetical protein
MSDKTNHVEATAGYDDELSAGKSLERQIMMDLLVTSGRFGLVVTVVVLAVQALSLG